MSRWSHGWLLILVVIGLAALALSGCVRPDHDPLAVYGFDPKSLELPVITFWTIGF
jgi:hypothetical protein